ncbi:MAG: adenylate/guanylate cyclase domain-containing protein [Thermoplasmata archaeon]
MARRLAAIMFTDIVDYASVAQVDEEGALQLVREQERLVRPILEARHGRKVRSIGDGRLIEFPDPLDAVECAVELQRRVHDRNVRDETPPLRIQVGIHLGEAERRGIGVLGDALDVASRIGPLAEPGGVCLTEPVYVRVHNRLPYQLERLGPRDLPGVREPIAVYHVVLPWIGVGTPPAGDSPPQGAEPHSTNIHPE